MAPRSLLPLLLLGPLGAPTARAGNATGLRGGPLGALLQEAALPAAPAPPGGNTVTVEFYYGTACGHCLYFLRLAILPLIEAGLPGDRVKLSVLPFIRIEDKIPVEISFWDTYCRQSDVCFYALAPVCALKVNVPAAVPVDNPELAKAVHFAECNQARRLTSHPDSQMQVTEEMMTTEDAESRQCAAQAGVAYDGAGGIKACADGPESLALVHSPGYTDRIRKFQHLLERSGKQQMPYIFLNGEDVLRCDGSEAGIDCSGIWTSDGTDRLLKQPGSLLHVVCARLEPPPPACAGVSAQRQQVGPTPKCENCAEVGPFHWQPTERPAGASLSSLGPAAILGAVACMVGWLVWRRTRQEVAAPEDFSTELIAE